MINLPNDDARRRAVEESLRLQVSFENVLARKLLKELRQFGGEARDGYKENEVEGLDRPWREHTERLRGVLLPAIESEMVFFGGRAIERLILTGVLSKQPTSSLDAFNQAVNYHIRTEGARKVVEISGTSRKIINSAVEDGLKTGQTREAIAQRIFNNNAGEIGKKRARIIASTETHSASVTADYFAMESTGIPFKKRWLTFIDQRTRGHHITADGQVKESSQPFEVGGQLLMHPGDPAGNAANVINCRCQMVYDFE